jgi:hypothetical protein
MAPPDIISNINPEWVGIISNKNSPTDNCPAPNMVAARRILPDNLIFCFRTINA